MVAVNSVGIWQFFCGIVVCMVVSVYLLGWLVVYCVSMGI